MVLTDLSSFYRHLLPDSCFSRYDLLIRGGMHESAAAQLIRAEVTAGLHTPAAAKLAPPAMPAPAARAAAEQPNPGQRLPKDIKDAITQRWKNEQTDGRRTCPSNECGATSEPGSNYCTNCGTLLVEKKDISTVDRRNDGDKKDEAKSLHELQQIARVARATADHLKLEARQIGAPSAKDAEQASLDVAFGLSKPAVLPSVVRGAIQFFGVPATAAVTPQMSDADREALDKAFTSNASGSTGVKIIGNRQLFGVAK